MPKPKRAPLRDTGGDPIITPNPVSEPAPPEPEPTPGAENPAPRAARTKGASSTPPGTVRVGLYIPLDILDAARAAVEADWEMHRQYDSWVDWLNAAVLKHAGYAPTTRARLCAGLPPSTPSKKVQRGTYLPEETRLAAEAARQEDRKAGHGKSLNAWVCEAIAIAVERTRKQLAERGETLPPPSQRLPGKLF